MKLRIDSLDDLTGWSISSPSTIFENEISQFIAGHDNKKSLVLNFDESDDEKIASKTFDEAIDVTDYDTLILSTWCQVNKKQAYKSISDFSYKIILNDTNEFYMQVYETFTNINIGIEDVKSITKIEIEALSEEADSLVISEMVVEKEDLNFDVLDSVEEQLEYEIETQYTNGLFIGTMSGNKDDDSITISNYPQHVGRYSVIKINDDTNSEYHQVDNNDGATYRFNSNYDGLNLLADYTKADVYLYFPVYKNPGQMEVRLPGIAIWGLDPEPVLRGNKLDVITDTFRESDMKERKDGQLYSYTILIDIESRSVMIRNILSRIVRKWIAKEVLWINGRYHEIYFSSKPSEQRGLEGVDSIAKIQYNLKVEAKENIFDRVVVPLTTDINIDVDIDT